MKRTYYNERGGLRTNSKSRGFTLVEMIVSTGIFVTVLSMSIGGLLTIINSNNKAQALRTAMDSMNFVLEEMSRHITQGNTYHCGAAGDLDTANSCSTASSTISFQSNKVGINRITYHLLNGEIFKTTTGTSPVTDLPLTTSSVVTITNLGFFVFAAEGGGDDQPRVIISVSGNVAVGDETTSFRAQTTAVQRLPKDI